MINQQLFFRKMRDVALRKSDTASCLSYYKSPREWRKLGKKKERKESGGIHPSRLFYNPRTLSDC